MFNISSGIKWALLHYRKKKKRPNPDTSDHNAQKKKPNTSSPVCTVFPVS